MPDLEKVPAGEAERIAHIVQLTVAQLKRRYEGKSPMLRGVHAKGHGCVQATFTVLRDLPEQLRVGVFRMPGRVYDAWIRFSNATVVVTPDSSPTGEHESRGMAIKLIGVQGVPLVPTIGPMTQDFLMINQPVFAFANVEDYEVVSAVLQRDADQAAAFFAERFALAGNGTPEGAEAARRAKRTLDIVQRIKSNNPIGAVPPQLPEPYQDPPASPLDADYFSAAPFLFGADHAVKFTAKPTGSRMVKRSDFKDPNYLRAALYTRLAPGSTPVTFDFGVQLRTATELADKLDTEIEDACVEWAQAVENVATITIPPQEFDTPERRRHCENLFFTPWHGLTEHRPLGGINRLRQAVYETSAAFRREPPEPGTGFDDFGRP